MFHPDMIDPLLKILHRPFVFYPRPIIIISIAAAAAEQVIMTINQNHLRTRQKRRAAGQNFVFNFFFLAFKLERRFSAWSSLLICWGHFHTKPCRKKTIPGNHNLSGWFCRARNIVSGIRDQTAFCTLSETRIFLFESFFIHLFSSWFCNILHIGAVIWKSEPMENVERNLREGFFSVLLQLVSRKINKLIRTFFHIRTHIQSTMGEKLYGSCTKVMLKVDPW